MKVKDFQRTAGNMIEDEREKVIIDLRKKEDFEKDTCDGAINIYWEELEDDFWDVYQDKPIYLLCYTGITSDEIAEVLQKKGMEAYSIAEGYRGYLKWKLTGI